MRGQTFTVQIGAVANRMGADHWNRGVNKCDWSWQNNEPIVLCVDSKGSMGCMPLLGQPQLVVEDVAWEGEKTLVKRAPIRGWTEHVAVKMAERSFFVLEGLRLGVASPFEHYDDGLDLLNGSSEFDALEDALRHWSEACDRIESTRIMFDGWNGFGGVAEKVSLYLEEEHAKACCVSLPLDRMSASDDSTAKCITRVSAAATIPLTCGELVEDQDFADDSLRKNILTVLQSRSTDLASVVRGKANLCWARRAESPCNRWNSPEKEDDREILSRNEISDGMVLGQSRYIAKALKRLSKLDDQTGNEIALLADLYFN